MFEQAATQHATLREKVPARQMEMMPGCMRRLMENVSYQEKVGYAQHVLGILVDRGAENLSREEREDHLASLLTVIPAS